MADLAVWQRTIVDEEGNVVPGAEIEVRREEDGSLATLYADRAGETPLANPLAADMSGFVRFFAQGDAYTITAVGAGSTRTWRFDPTGRLQEFDRVSEALAIADGADTLETRRQLGEFATVADVQSRHIPAVLESIRTEGYYSPGDGGGALYVVGDEGSGAIQSGDGRWWKPVSKIVDVKQFGARFDGVTDDTIALQTAIEAGIALNECWVLLLPPGDTVVSDELDFTSATQPFAIVGAGPRLTRFLPTPFGASKSVLNLHFNENGNRRVINLQLRGFSIVGNSDKRDPIGVYHPYPHRLRMYDVDIGEVGNIPFVGYGAFNSEINNCNWTSCGWQPLWKEVPGTAKVSVSESSTTVTCNEGVFDSNDVGKIIYIRNAGVGGSSANSALAAKITSVTNPNTVEIDTPAYNTVSSVNFSFDVIRGSVSSGSATLTLDRSVFDQDDVGRLIFIDGAGPSGGTLITRVASVSGSSVTIEDAAVATVTDARVWTSTAMLMAQEQWDYGGNVTNDIRIAGIQIENYRGPAVLIHRAQQVFFEHLKAHGRSHSPQNNFAFSGPVIAGSCQRTFVTNGEFEFGYNGTDSGYIHQTGDGGELSIENVALVGPTTGGYFARQAGGAKTLYLGTILSIYFDSRRTIRGWSNSENVNNRVYRRWNGNTEIVDDADDVVGINNIFRPLSENTPEGGQFYVALNLARNHESNLQIAGNTFGQRLRIFGRNQASGVWGDWQEIHHDGNRFTRISIDEPADYLGQIAVVDNDIYIAVGTGGTSGWRNVNNRVTRNDISTAPDYVGQIAISDGEAYIAVGTGGPGGWKQIT